MAVRRLAAPLLLPMLLLLAGAPRACGLDACPLYACYQAHASNHQLLIDPALDPFDPLQVAVDAVLVSPAGLLVVQPCFWEVPQERYQQVAMSTERGKEVPWERFRASAGGRWSMRVQPPGLGTWQWHWRVRCRQAPERLVAGGALTITPARQSGPLLLSAAHGLASSDGQPCIPIGINIAWPNEGGSGMFAQYLEKLHAAGGNCARVWLVHYYGGTCLEWSHGDMNGDYQGIGHYSQEAAARVDALLEAADHSEIRLMLCLWTFGDFSFDWHDNPYASTSPGGYLERPAQFFTDPRALRAQRQLLRYAVARWSAYRSLGMWELWNEVDNCTGFADGEVGSWHRQMAHALHDLDPLAHPITTSYRFTPPLCPCSGYDAPDLALVQCHTYWPSLVSAVQTEGGSLGRFAKPWQLGEFGMSVDADALAADPDGLHLHDGMWAALLAGSIGGGFGWWWDSNIEAHDLWRHLTGISRFTQGEDLSDLVPAHARSDTPTSVVLERSSGLRIWAWVRTLRTVKVQGVGMNVSITTYAIGHGPPARTIVLANAGDGPWQATWSDPYDGTWMASSSATASGGTLRLTVPPYRDDISLKAWHVDGPARAAAAVVPATPWHDELRRRAALRTP